MYRKRTLVIATTASLLIGFVAGGFCHALSAFYAMESNFRARQSVIRAVTTYVQTEHNWPDSWEELGKHIPSESQLKWLQEIVHVTFANDLTHVANYGPERYITAKGITLPAESLDGDIDALRNAVKAALNRG